MPNLPVGLFLEVTGEFICCGFVQVLFHKINQFLLQYRLIVFKVYRNYFAVLLVRRITTFLFITKFSSLSRLFCITQLRMLRFANALPTWLSAFAEIGCSHICVNLISSFSFSSNGRENIGSLSGILSLTILLVFSSNIFLQALRMVRFCRLSHFDYIFFALTSS